MIELLSKIPIFASLGKKEIVFLAEIARNVEYPANTVLFREGEVGDRLFIIIDGELDVVKGLGTPDELLLRVCGPCDHVGEMCLMNPEGVRSASVKTRTAVRVLEIIQDDFEALMARRASVAFAIAQELTRRMLDSESQWARGTALDDGQSAGMKNAGSTGRDSGTSVPDDKESDTGKLSGRAIPLLQIKTFGNFQVLRGETVVGGQEWKAKQPKLLLKALIARGATGVPKDLLIEDLWPEISPVSGESSFKVLLHRLRKALEPEMDRALGSSYLVLKENLVSLKKDRCRVDSDEFLILRQKGRRAEQAEDIRRAILCYKSAIDLYRGDFLAEDLYVPWAEQRRNELRAMYIDLLSRMAELYQAQGSSKKAIECYKLMIRADSVCEEAYQKLMLTYSYRGMRAEAIKLYEEFKNALETELGVEPSDLTVSIYRKISKQT